jgi:NhaP-type Na+/H+ or K+/H+ antiporter
MLHLTSTADIVCLIVVRAGLEIVLTLGAAYGCHFVTEDLLGASGLLAVVVMGFSMSILGADAAAMGLCIICRLQGSVFAALCFCCTLLQQLSSWGWWWGFRSIWGLGVR